MADGRVTYPWVGGGRVLGPQGVQEQRTGMTVPVWPYTVKENMGKVCFFMGAGFIKSSLFIFNFFFTFYYGDSRSKELLALP